MTLPGLSPTAPRRPPSARCRFSQAVSRAVDPTAPTTSAPPVQPGRLGRRGFNRARHQRAVGSAKPPRAPPIRPRPTPTRRRASQTTSGPPTRPRPTPTHRRFSRTASVAANSPTPSTNAPSNQPNRLGRRRFDLAQHQHAAGPAKPPRAPPIQPCPPPARRRSARPPQSPPIRPCPPRVRRRCDRVGGVATVPIRPPGTSAASGSRRSTARPNPSRPRPRAPTGRPPTRPEAASPAAR